MKKILLRIYYDFLLGPQGYGRPVPEAVWQEQYTNGVWHGLNTVDEMAHYAIIAGYIRYLNPNISILDVGCGTGILSQWLDQKRCHYTGIDLASNAISEAVKKNQPGSTFLVCDFNAFETTQKFDIIAFNEALYYSRDPQATLLKYALLLQPEGSFIISMCRHGHNAAVWSRIDQTVSWIHGTHIKNSRGCEWEIRIAKPTRANRSPK